MIAKSRVQTEFAGACFSPDGSTLFVNLYGADDDAGDQGAVGQGKVCLALKAKARSDGD